jgi:hypothetical protein
MAEAIDNFCIQHEKASAGGILQTKHICISELGEDASIVQVRRSKKPCKVKRGKVKKNKVKKESARRRLISFYPCDQEAIEAIKRFHYIADLRIPTFGPSKICQVGLLLLEDMIEQDPKALERLLLQSRRA